MSHRVRRDRARARERIVVRTRDRTDVSLDALAVARTNASAVLARCARSSSSGTGSLLGPVPEARTLRRGVDPPYIAFGERHRSPSVYAIGNRRLALFSGDEGMETTADLIRDAAPVLAAAGCWRSRSMRAARHSRPSWSCRHGMYAEVRVLLDLTAANGRGRQTTGGAGMIEDKAKELAADRPEPDYQAVKRANDALGRMWAPWAAEADGATAH